VEVYYCFQYFFIRAVGKKKHQQRRKEKHCACEITLVEKYAPNDFSLIALLIPVM